MHLKTFFHNLLFLIVLKMNLPQIIGCPLKTRFLHMFQSLQFKLILVKCLFSPSFPASLPGLEAPCNCPSSPMSLMVLQILKICYCVGLTSLSRCEYVQNLFFPGTKFIEVTAPRSSPASFLNQENPIQGPRFKKLLPAFKYTAAWSNPTIALLFCCDSSTGKCYPFLLVYLLLSFSLFKTAVCFNQKWNLKK